MTNTDLRSVKEILESKLRETMQAPSWRDSITIEPTADPVDATQQTLEREMETKTPMVETKADDSRCCICLGKSASNDCVLLGVVAEPPHDDDNPLAGCTKCGISVHRECYGNPLSELDTTRC